MASPATTEDRYRLTITSGSFEEEFEDDPDGPHMWEDFYLQFCEVSGFGLPLEDTLFIHIERNSEVEDAFENRVLTANITLRESLITDFANSVYRETGLCNYQIVNSVPIPLPPFAKDLTFDFPTVAYSDLKHGPEIRRYLKHRLVTYAGIAYLWKEAALSDGLERLEEELANYQKLAGSRWIAEIGGIVLRQGRRTSFLIQYYPQGDLRQHFDASDLTKQKWLTQLAQAIIEFNGKGFHYRDLKCANIIVDNDNNIRIVDLETFGNTEGWAHPNEPTFYMPNEEFLSTHYPIPWHSDVTEPQASQSTIESDPQMPPFLNPASGNAYPSVLESSEPGFPRLLSQQHTEVDHHLHHEIDAYIRSSLDKFGAMKPKPPTAVEWQKFQIYSFGKTAWELFAGCKVPTNEDDLKGTPGWVQTLVHRCCKQEDFDSMEDILRFLESLNNEEMRHGEKPGI